MQRAPSPALAQDPLPRLPSPRPQHPIGRFVCIVVDARHAKDVHALSDKRLFVQLELEGTDEGKKRTRVVEANDGDSHCALRCL